MPRLFPSRSESTIERSEDPSVLYADSEAVGDVFSTLASETALGIFRVLNDQPLTVSEVADELDLSIQNASYHLENLHEADLIEVIDTCYSKKGREMDIYAVTRDPKVVVLSTQGDRGSLRQAFGQMAAAVGLPAVGIAVWHSFGRIIERLVET